MPKRTQCSAHHHGWGLGHKKKALPSCDEQGLPLLTLRLQTQSPALMEATRFAGCPPFFQ